MTETPLVSRVIVVVLDGLRADIPPLLQLPVLQRLMERGTSSLCARTVSPSVTAAAMGSLFTGVRPVEHGLTSDRFRIPRPTVPLAPLPRVLHDARVSTHAFLARVPFAYRGVARALARLASVKNAHFHGNNALDIVRGAALALAAHRHGFFFFHLPDADRAGHAHGWTSRDYMAAARRLDAALGELLRITDAANDPDTLLIALADHGGGGTFFRDHESDHPHDVTIPMVLAGGRVSFGELAPFSSLLDVPPTVLWALGVAIPDGWCGRPLREAFAGAVSLGNSMRDDVIALASR